MRVLFNSVDEFKHDVTLELDRIEPKILRVTKEWLAIKLLPTVRHVIVRASVIVPPHLTELRFYCGQDWGTSFKETETTHKKAEDLIETLSVWGDSIGLEVRAGAVEMDDGDKQ